MDIRNYFSVLGKKDGSSNSKPAAEAKPSKSKKTKRIIDSDDEDPMPTKKKVTTINLSDSDDEIFSSNKKRKAEEEKKKSKISKARKATTPHKPLKETSAASFFGSAPVAHKSEGASEKRKTCEPSPKKQDARFEKTLQQLDDSSLTPSKKSRQDVSETKDNSANRNRKKGEEHSSDSKGNCVDLHNKSKGAYVTDNKRENLNDTTDYSPPKQNENSPPLKQSSVSLSGKLAAKAKSRSSDYDSTKSSTTNHITSEKKLQIKQASPREGLQTKNILNSDDSNKNPEKELPSLTRKSSTKHLINSEASDKSKDKLSRKSSMDIIDVRSPKKSTGTPNKIKKETGDSESTTHSSSKTKDNSATKNQTPKKEVIGSPDPFKDDSIISTPTADDYEEKKKQRSIDYKKYLQRSGPRNPGSKTIPEGAPECLSGLVFVQSGVLDSLDKVEMTELLQQYGGRVVSAVSGKTTHLIAGEDCGASKMNKAEKLGTTVVSEDDVLEMIRTRPAKKGAGSTSCNKQKSKGSSNNSSKKQEITVAASSPKPVETISVSSSAPVRSLISSFQSNTSSENSQDTSQSSTQKTQPISTQELKDRPSEMLMWVDKYKPSALKNIIGQQGDKSNARKLLHWLKSWSNNHSTGNKNKLGKPSPWAKDNDGSYFKAALLSGPPGVGKTTTAQIVCRELGYDTVELNASDTRSKRSLTEEVAQMLSNTSLSNFAAGTGREATSRHHVLLMDEVDGMAGNEDRGGVAELITLLKSSRIPIICMCNDRQHPKIRSLANHCFDLRFYKPRVEQIRGAMMSVCYREGIKIAPDALDQIIVGSNQDVRQVLNHLSMFSAKEKNMKSDQIKQDANKAKKDFKIGPWDVCRQVFTESERKNMSIHQKSDLFFHDYSIGPLFVQENYWKARPKAAQTGGRVALLKLLSKAARSIADGDLVERAIRSNNNWSLLPTQALFSCVLPGEAMSGHLAGEIEFPSWLGNNSKKNKMDRLAQELHHHMRLRISGNKTDVSLEYSKAVRDRIVLPLVSKGQDGIGDAVSAITEYYLLREDLDSLGELSHWSGAATDPFARVDSKVKAAFTRAFNKSSAMNPYSIVVAPKKKKGASASLSIGEDGEPIEDDGEDDDDGGEGEDVTADAMIKVKKPSVSKKASAGTSAAAGKGRGKSKK